MKRKPELDLGEVDFKDLRKGIVLGLAIVLLAFLAEHSGALLSSDAQLARRPPTEGSYLVDLTLNADEVLNDYAYTLKIPEQKWTKAQAKENFRQAKKEIDESFFAEGESADYVTKNVILKEYYVKDAVRAEWSFDNYCVMDMEGRIHKEHTTEDGTWVKATAELRCGEYKESYSFPFVVYPPKLSRQEQLLSKIEELLSKEEEKKGREALQLPREVDGISLTWAEQKEHLALKVLLLELVVGVLLVFVKRERRLEAEKQRKSQMELDYAEVVNKLLILLGSGMSLKQAWNKISARYLDKRENENVGQRWIYEEMLLTSHEMSDGESERMAYQKFGERTGLGAYHRLMSILIQNLQTGSKGLCQLLEQEAITALEDRKALAKKLGEEASTKMLLPLILMLGIVMAIIMVPAIMSFAI